MMIDFLYTLNKKYNFCSDEDLGNWIVSTHFKKGEISNRDAYEFIEHCCRDRYLENETFEKSQWWSEVLKEVSEEANKSK